jgi:cytochrome c1
MTRGIAREATRLATALGLAGAVAFAASSDAPQQGAAASYRLSEAPATWAAPLAAADAAVQDVQRRLSARLQEELKKGGPALAIAVCRDEAQALTAAAAREHSLRVGRTSHRLRNPGNAAPAWAAPLVAAAAGRKAADTEAVAVDLGDHVGLLRPIPTAAPCLQCHGAPELAPEVEAFLNAAYPDDRAVGFEEGDLRGWFWAEAGLAAPGRRTPAAAGPDPERHALGERLFAEANPRCVVCHSVAGTGNPQGTPLDGVGGRLAREEIRAWIRTPAEMAKRRGARQPPMVPYPEFSDDELAALVEYLAGLPPSAPRD